MSSTKFSFVPWKTQAESKAIYDHNHSHLQERGLQGQERQVGKFPFAIEEKGHEGLGRARCQQAEV